MEDRVAHLARGWVVEGEGRRVREGLPRKVTPDLGFLHEKKGREKILLL